MACDVRTAPRPAATARRLWLGATILLTLVPFVLVVALAPSGSARPAAALTWLLFAGSSVHVAATGWFYSVPEVRAHMNRHRLRYVVVPVVLVAALAVVAPTLSGRTLSTVLVGFFGWQFLHFQKQNLGVAALAARAGRVAGLSRWERRALVVAGAGGIAGLAGHPALLQVGLLGSTEWLFLAGFLVFAGGAFGGAAGLTRRPPADRNPAFLVVYASALLFFAPVFLFSSPYAAVAGLTIAHGLQYLLLVGLLAAAPTAGRPVVVSVLVFVNVAVLLGLVLNQVSHLHGSGAPGRALFGAYLGLVCAHFVVDAGLWRLRDEFPRRFLGARLPFLLGP